MWSELKGICHTLVVPIWWRKVKITVDNPSTSCSWGIVYCYLCAVLKIGKNLLIIYK